MAVIADGGTEATMERHGMKRENNEYGLFQQASGWYRGYARRVGICCALLVGTASQTATGAPDVSGLYQANCAECHGADLRGTDKGPGHLSVVYEPNHHGDAAFALAVYSGVRQHHWPFGDMAPVEGLDDDDIARIVAFVRENQRVSGFEPYPP